MSDHYYSKEPTSKSEPKLIEIEVLGQVYRLYSDRGVFSKSSLDKGSKLLIETMPIRPTDRILDWGTGYGIIGLVAANLAKQGQVEMIDINERAVNLALQNINLNGINNAFAYSSEGFNAVKGSFDLIVSNPPFRAGKAIVHELVDKAPNYLVEGGGLCLVVQKKQGAESLTKKMAEVFNNVDILARSGGYRVLFSKKGTF